MDNANGPDLDVDYVDGVHPRASGYNKMANIWFEAIKDLCSAI